MFFYRLEKAVYVSVTLKSHKGKEEMRIGRKKTDIVNKHARNTSVMGSLNFMFTMSNRIRVEEEDSFRKSLLRIIVKVG